MALLMPTAPIASGLSFPTMMVSTTDMAIHPSSESTTGMASSNSAPSSLRKRVLGDAWLAGVGEGMALLTLIDLSLDPKRTRDVTLNKVLVEQRGHVL